MPDAPYEGLASSQAQAPPSGKEQTEDGYTDDAYVRGARGRLPSVPSCLGRNALHSGDGEGARSAKLNIEGRNSGGATASEGGPQERPASLDHLRNHTHLEERGTNQTREVDSPLQKRAVRDTTRLRGLGH